MHNIWTIARRELKHYFISPIAYAVAFMILLIVGVIFYTNLLASLIYQQFAPSIDIVVGPIVTLILFTTPAITMRTLADEQRSGTMELILTAPVRDWELVTGKWLGAFLFYLIIVLITWFYPIILNQLISPGIDQGLMVANYLGLLLLIASLTAIGVAVSSIFSNQIAAFFVTAGILLFFWMIGFPSQAMGASTIAEILKYLDLSEHFFSTFYEGVVELKNIVYYLSMTGLALFLGTISIQSRRWR
jgi:ABC-2 type transport system permease protein